MNCSTSFDTFTSVEDDPKLIMSFSNCVSRDATVVEAYLDSSKIDEDRLDALSSKEKIKITKPTILLPQLLVFVSPRPAVNELDHAAATKLQKVYKSYRTRRNLADCAVVVEELWWKTLDSAALKQWSVSFFEKQESAASRWARAKSKVAKVGKGSSKDEKAQKLALQHWLEAVHPLDADCTSKDGICMTAQQQDIRM